MSSPLVSVVVPCFNGAAHLPACILSILHQQTDCEILVVDDGSTDDTREVALAQQKTCPMPLLLVSQKNAGVAAARNAGLRLARGKYICFLDVDDRYKPGFFLAVLPTLERDPSAAGVACGVEFIGCDRPLEAWQIEAVEATLPSNFLARTSLVRTVGGFPEDPAFRGPAAGEDQAFRTLLNANGLNKQIHKRFLNYNVRDSRHFKLFLERGRPGQGKVEMNFQTPEDADGSVERATVAFNRAFEDRTIAKFSESIGIAIVGANTQLALTDHFRHIEGTLHDHEAYVLYVLARYWPRIGLDVVIGSPSIRAAAWLALGGQEGNRKPVVVVSALLESRRLDIESQLKSVKLDGHIKVHADAPVELAGERSETIRLLFLDGDHSFEATAADFNKWSPHVGRHGLVAFHEVDVSQGVTLFVRQLLAGDSKWKLFGRHRSLAVFQRVE